MTSIPESTLETKAKLSWILSFRLISFLLVLTATFFFIPSSNFLTACFFFYFLLTLSFLIILFFSAKYPIQNLFYFSIGLQLTLEVLIEAILVYNAGGVVSFYSILFIPTIVSASLIYQLVGTLFLASWASLAYAFSIFYISGLDLSDFMNFEVFKSLYHIEDAYFSTIFFHTCIFYLVAFLSGYLAQKLKTKAQELESASSELKKAQMATDDILQHLHSGVITIDTSGMIIYFNRMAEDILGYKASEIRGYNCLQVFNERMPELGEKLMRVLKSKQIEIRKELSIKNKEGKKIPIGISTSILGNEKMGLRGVIVIFQDLTEVKQLEEEIRTKDKLAAVGELSAGIAHEIRNPLASISGSVEVLKQELKLSGENKKLLDLIIKESSRLNQILTEFLNFAKIKHSKLMQVELNKIMDEVIEVVKKQPAWKPKISISKEIDNYPLYASGDENQIKQLLLNLAVNALEAMESGGGKLTFSNKSLEEIEGFYFYGEEEPKHADWIPIAVIDQGKGMTEEEIEKMFLPFYSTKKNGTGLGLAIVQRLVDSLNAKLECKSRQKEGTAFVIYFQKYKTEPQKTIFKSYQL